MEVSISLYAAGRDSQDGVGIRKVTDLAAGMTDATFADLEMPFAAWQDAAIVGRGDPPREYDAYQARCDAREGPAVGGLPEETLK